MVGKIQYPGAARQILFSWSNNGGLDMLVIWYRYMAERKIYTEL